MRFVPMKTVEQQATLALHRARQGFVSARTAQSNQLRGLLSEFGIVMPKKISNLKRRMPEILEDAENGLSHASRELFARLYAHFKELDRQVAELERQIKVCHREDPASRRLEAIPGIGPLSASALAASIGDAKGFQKWPTTCGLAGPRPTPALQRRQGTVTWHQQAWRHVSAHALDSWCALGATHPKASWSSNGWMARASSRATQREYRSRCAREQECSRHLGAACP
jgi:hypothetical protein